MSGCLSRHELPRTPADLGLSPAEFTKAVLCAPATRPGRYTILERLELDESATARQVADFTVAAASGASQTSPASGASQTSPASGASQTSPASGASQTSRASGG
jgi:hypothetical protein